MTSAPGPAPEWFDGDDPARLGHPNERGLRFSCTMCGNCCTGPAGYVLLSVREADALARRLGISSEDFLARYTHMTQRGRSLTETPSEHGLDCVFLDRESVPGRAVCGVYEDRPSQCRTWPFWPENLRSLESWRRARRRCPGMDQGTLIPPEEIRIRRADTPA